MTTEPYVGAESDDHLNEECAVFGVFGGVDAGALTPLGLHALQHRGQEATGIVTFDGEQFHAHRGNGHVSENFSAQSNSYVSRLKGQSAIGHKRYSTSGETNQRNIQPLFADFEFGGMVICYNGNLTNAFQLRHALVRRGCLFQSTTDTETIVHLIARSHQSTVDDCIVYALHQVEGTYYLVCLTQRAMIGVRDPRGVRPLVLGRLGDTHILASETCALDIIGAEFVRDVEAGEVVVINAEGVTSLFPFRDRPRRFCIFEYIYFARPDSIVEGTSVYRARQAIGAALASEASVPADVIIPVPESGVPAALGYATQAGIPFDLGIIHNQYVGRTFIKPSDSARHLGVKLKHNANRAMVEGQRLVLVDVSIVGGTTSTKIVEMIRAAGAREVHVRIASPPTAHSCFHGVDTPERDKLMAAAS